MTMPTTDAAGPAAAGTRGEVPVLANYIGGRWVRSSAPGELDLTNPATGEVVGRVPLSGVEDVSAAVAAAQAAWPAWRSAAVGERSAVIFALRERFRARLDELARSVTLEGGKTLSDARAEVASHDRGARGGVRHPA